MNMKQNVDKILPQAISGRIIKMSTHQWSQNERLLKVDDACLQYYSKVPPDFNPAKMESFEMDKGKFKPKSSVALTHITEVGDLTPEEQTKFKKQFA